MDIKKITKGFFRLLGQVLAKLFVVTLRLGLFCAMLALLIFTGAWLLFLYAFNAQNISEVVVEQLQQRLDRPVVISSMDLRFVNTIELKGFSVVDTKGAPGETFVSAESVLITFKLMPLFERELVIDKVILNAPRFNVVRLADGTTNIPVLQETQEPSSLYLSNPQKPFSVTTDTWIVYRGEISYNDLQKKVSHALYNVDLYVDNLRFDRLSHFKTSMMLRNRWEKNVSDIEIRAEGGINLGGFDWKKFALRSLNAQVSLLDEPIDLVLDLDNLLTPFFKARLQVPAFTDKNIAMFGWKGKAFALPKTAINVQGQLTQNYRHLKLPQAAVRGDDMEITGEAVLDFTKKQPHIELTATTSTFDLPKAAKYYAQLKKYNITGKGALHTRLVRSGTKWQVPLFTAQLENAAADLYGFKTDGVSGEFQAKSNFSDLYAHAKKGHVQVDRTSFDKLDISASWRKGDLYANIHTSEVNKVPLKMSLLVENLTDPQRKITTRMYWKTYDPLAFIETVKDFVRVITPLTNSSGDSVPEVTGALAWLRNFRDRLPNFMPNFKGLLTADSFSSPLFSGGRFDAEFDLTGLREGGKELTGTVQTRISDSVVYQMEKWAEEQSALNVTFQPFIIMHRMERAGSFKIGRVLKDVAITDLAAGAVFTNGKMDLQNAYTVGPAVSAGAEGWVDWIKERFDMTIGTMFTNTSRRGALAENLTDESGDPALMFRVSSSMLKPKVEMKRAKKTGATIRAAQQRGLTTDFSEAQHFREGEFHATK